MTPAPADVFLEFLLLRKLRDIRGTYPETHDLHKISYTGGKVPWSDLRVPDLDEVEVRVLKVSVLGRVSGPEEAELADVVCLRPASMDEEIKW